MSKTNTTPDSESPPMFSKELVDAAVAMAVTNVPAALQSPEVLAVMRNIDVTAEAAGVGLDVSSRAHAATSQLLRRLAGIARARMHRQAAMHLEITAIEQFHAPYFARFDQAQFVLKAAVEALRPSLPFPVKNGKPKKTLQFPYGSVGYKESGGDMRKQKDVDGKDDPIADALLDRWCVLERLDGTQVFRIVEVTGDELMVLRADMLARTEEDPLALFDEGQILVKRPTATEIKSALTVRDENNKVMKDADGYPLYTQFPDGMERAPEKVTEVVTWDGLAVGAVEAMDVSFQLEESEHE